MGERERCCVCVATEEGVVGLALFFCYGCRGALGIGGDGRGGVWVGRSVGLGRSSGPRVLLVCCAQRGAGLICCERRGAVCWCRVWMGGVAGKYTHGLMDHRHATQGRRQAAANREAAAAAFHVPKPGGGFPPSRIEVAWYNTKRLQLRTPFGIHNGNDLIGSPPAAFAVRAYMDVNGSPQLEFTVREGGAWMLTSCVQQMAAAVLQQEVKSATRDVMIVSKYEEGSFSPRTLVELHHVLKGNRREVEASSFLDIDNFLPLPLTWEYVGTYLPDDLVQECIAQATSSIVDEQRLETMRDAK
eukprot:876871-Prymnesium_polylepis.1